ncbi:MAG: hypothetical protein AAGF74_02820 [Pseudomonadota bacterium]
MDSGPQAPVWRPSRPAAPLFRSRRAAARSLDVPTSADEFVFLAEAPWDAPVPALQDLPSLPAIRRQSWRAAVRLWIGRALQFRT